MEGKETQLGKEVRYWLPDLFAATGRKGRSERVPILWL